MGHMLKKQSYIFQYVSLFFWVIVLVGCSGGKEEVLKECKNNSDLCLSMSNEGVKIDFNTDHLVVENFYQMTIQSESNITRAYLKGVNMDMGTIELPLKKAEENVYSANLMLGMCSEPVMKWQLTLESSNATLSRFELTSYWSKAYIK